MRNNQIIRFKLSLSSEQFLRVYQGAAKNIAIRTDDGQVVHQIANKRDLICV